MLDYTAGVQQCWSRHNGEAETYSPGRIEPRVIQLTESHFLAVTGGVQKPFSGLTVTSV
jgi:hypothetical protein